MYKLSADENASVTRKDNLDNKPKWLRILIGRFRWFFTFCANCNSDAPEKDYCEICNSGRIKKRKDHWRRFRSANYLNRTPKEDLPMCSNL